MFPNYIACIFLTFKFLVLIKIAGHGNHRNSDIGIKRRMIAGVMSTIIIAGVTYFFSGNFEFFRFDFFDSFLKPILLTVTLFMGSWDEQRPKHSSWMNIRNLAVAPFCEEVIFRWAFPVILGNNIYGKAFSTLLFWFSHVPGTLRNFHQNLFTLSYTALFSALSFLYIEKFQNVFSAVVCHSVCNFFGAPSMQISKNLPGIILFSFLFISL
jgi:Type II CAAX prenyl endopeptidase Rce1-like